jgi:uncharacterized protein (DUF1015 family)
MRYDFQSLDGLVSDRIAPPYDVLDEAGKAGLMAKSDRNIVSVDLPHVPPKSLGPAECYATAANTLESWISDGTLVCESTPALYVYHQTFDHEGSRLTRPMFFARVKLVPFEDGVVLAHEKTFGGPKEDRLALMKATRVNLSAVFGMYHDPENEIRDAFASHIDRKPDATATLDGVENALWIVTDPQVIASVVSLMADRRIYIADGHHRYTTALNYRDWLAGEAGGSLAEDHPAQFGLMALAGMDDPGNLIKPTHRVLVELGDVTLDDLVSAWSDGCEEASAGEEDIELATGVDGPGKRLRFTNRRVLDTLEPSMSDAWKSLDLAYLHRYLLEELFVPSLGGGKPPTVRYIKSDRDARQAAADAGGIAIMCKAPTMTELREVSEAGDVMPQKSTYFYPKIATGLVVNPLH